MIGFILWDLSNYRPAPLTKLQDVERPMSGMFPINKCDLILVEKYLKSVDLHLAIGSTVTIGDVSMHTMRR